jgi:G3E family GTPase
MPKTPIKKLPVLVISGFLGSGKTTLLNQLLTNNQNRKIAIIVNDIGEVNIDAELIRQNGLSISQTTENVVEISNGCICCTLREDLLIEVKKLVALNCYDYLVIESSGISEPIPVAQTFTFDEGTDDTLSKLTKLDCMLTTVDCSNFLDIMKQGKTLIDVGQELNEEDTRSLSGLLIEQVEFANVLLLTKTDLVTNETLQNTKALLQKLNPYANIIQSIKGNIEFEEILDTNMFDFDKASSQAGWIKELQKPIHKPESAEYGISSFVYRSRKPFEKEKFYKLLSSSEFKNIVRAKGYYWIKEDPNFAYEFSQSGVNQEYDSPVGQWWAAVEKKNWPQDPEYIKMILGHMIEPIAEIGDRRQELVFIGQNLNQEKIVKSLDECC